MSNRSNDSEAAEDENIDPAEPIAELAGFEHEVPVGFLDRIRRAIGRRTTAAQVTLFALDTPIVVLKEFWLLVIELFDSKKAGKDTDR